MLDETEEALAPRDGRAIALEPAHLDEHRPVEHRDKVFELTDVSAYYDGTKAVSDVSMDGLPPADGVPAAPLPRRTRRCRRLPQELVTAVRGLGYQFAVPARSDA